MCGRIRIFVAVTLVAGLALAAASQVIGKTHVVDNQVGAALNGHAGPVSSVAFSPNSGTIATATENGTVQLWDVPHRSRVGTLRGLAGIIDSVAFSPRGRTVAAGSRAGLVLLWDAPSG